MKVERDSENLRQALVVLVGMMGLVFFAAREFRASHLDEPLFPAEGLTAVKRLAEYFPAIGGSRGDTEVYFFDGAEPGGTLLVLGGTHPNEAAGFMAACLLLENVRVGRGRLIVIPRTNRSGFTHTEAGEAFPLHFRIDTPAGSRFFRYGSRFANPLDQWPDPEVYLHYPSKQELSGGETRNLNRNFPGRPDGTFTERVTHAITSLVTVERVDLVIDLHEASPEYPVINAIIAHERAMDVAALANLTLQSEGIAYSLEPSPVNFRGLTHRELGDATEAMAVLMETANVAQGRLRGRSEAQKVVTGFDRCYLDAAGSDLVRVPYDSTGIPLTVRAGRHLDGIRSLVDAMSLLYPERAIGLERVPSLADIEAQGLGAYLQPKSTSTQQ